MKYFNRIIAFFKNYWIINVILLIFLLFHKFFEEFISSYLVGIYDLYFDKSWLTDLIFCIGVLMSGLFLISNIIAKKYISNWKNYTAIIILFIWIYYRFSNPIWDYSEVFHIDAIKYIDITIVFCLSIILSKILYSKQELKVESDKGLVCDNAITKSGEDKLGRNDIAKDLADKMSNTKANAGSLAFGIVAPWGYGKTSFLNLLVNHLLINGSEVIWFNPWRFDKDKNLTLAFFNELSLTLKKYNSELASDILNYAHVLSSVDNTAIKVINKIIEGSGQSDFQSRFTAIDKTIKNIGKHIFVIVDDIDRLDHNEIADVLKLIRNSANFTNIIFIGAYDRSYLISALEKINPYQKSVYLEKIFQFEFTLPDFETDILNKQILFYLKQFVDSSEKDLLEKALLDNKFLNIYTGFIDSPISNMRDVKRFVNSFKVAYERLKGEVDLVDLMNVEILRLKYSTIYDLIVSKWEEFLTTKNYYTHQLMLWSEKQNTPDSSFNFPKVNLKEYINEHSGELNINKTDIQNINLILDKLFPEFGSINDNLNRINNQFSIRRYFFYSLLESDLSEKEFDNIWSESFDDIKIKIDNLIDSKCFSIVAQISKRIPQNREEYKNIVRTIFYIGSLQKGYANDLDDVIRFLSMKSYFDSDTEYKSFILEVLRENKTNEFCLKYLNLLYDKNRIFDYRFITVEELKNLNLEFFSDLISENIDIRTCLYNLYYTMTKEWIEVGGGHWKIEEIRNKDADQLFIDYAKTKPIELFKSIISKSRDSSERYIINEIVKSIWVTWENFEQFVYEVSDTSGEILEFKRFMKLCKENEYTKYVTFEFEFTNLN
jgi:hypothetical protein